MGWEKGSGLGAQGQGEVEPIAVRQKDDSKGIGYKVRRGGSQTFICSNYFLPAAKSRQVIGEGRGKQT